MTTLHPPKHPRNCTEIAETTSGTSSRGPRTDPHMLQFLDRSCLLEVGQDCFVLGDLFPVELKSVVRHFLQGRFALLVQVFDLTRTRQRFQRRCNHQLEISFREYPIRVLPIHHFALFGDLYLTLEGALWLRNDRVMRWSTTAPDRSTSPMKQGELYVAFGSDAMQRAMGLEYLPGAGEHPAILV